MYVYVRTYVRIGKKAGQINVACSTVGDCRA